MAIEKFEVRNRWTKAVQFTAEISVTPDMLPRVKIGLKNTCPICPSPSAPKTLNREVDKT